MRREIDHLNQRANHCQPGRPTCAPPGRVANLGLPVQAAFTVLTLQFATPFPRFCQSGESEITGKFANGISEIYKKPGRRLIQ